jgi:hypothetical protein
MLTQLDLNLVSIPKCQPLSLQLEKEMGCSQIFFHLLAATYTIEIAVYMKRDRVYKIPA